MYTWVCIIEDSLPTVLKYCWGLFISTENMPMSNVWFWSCKLLKWHTLNFRAFHFCQVYLKLYNTEQMSRYTSEMLSTEVKLNAWILVFIERVVVVVVDFLEGWPFIINELCQCIYALKRLSWRYILLYIINYFSFYRE